MSVSEASLLKKIRSAPETVSFKDLMSVIENHYIYCPTTFTNGEGGGLVSNSAGTNEGSCKIFAFAKRHKLSQDQTLHCFGDYYREDVLKNPHGNDHGNIRAFMKYGWKAVVFEGEALQEK